MASRQQRLSSFHRIGPFALVGVGLAVVVIDALIRAHRIDRFMIYYFCAIVPSLILHEMSHAGVAYAFGDDTAKVAGRISFNPLRHISWVGTIILPAALLIAGGPAFGWAKPVPINVSKLRHSRNSSVLVSLAGPATNIVIALAAGLAARAMLGPNPIFFSIESSAIVPSFLFTLGLVNAIVAAFNLIPIPPLDGSAVLERFIPTASLPTYYRMRQYTMILVIFVVLFDQNLLSSLLNHVAQYWYDIVF